MFLKTKARLVNGWVLWVFWDIFSTATGPYPFYSTSQVYDLSKVVEVVAAMRKHLGKNFPKCLHPNLEEKIIAEFPNHPCLINIVHLG